MKILIAVAFVVIAAIVFVLGSNARANELKVGDAAPEFKAKTQDGTPFDLASRKGAWTVLYFYPKAGTPGCTKQACSFRDNIKKITDQGAAVYGVSADSVEAQLAFHKEHRLNFDLLADPDESIIKAFGTKMPLLPMSKRWTFIVGPDLKIRSVAKDVDPVLDSENTAKSIAALKAAKPETTK